MASIFAESDHIAHVNTQIPYALVPASIAGVLYLSYSIVGSSVILLVVGIVIQFLVLRYLGNRYEKKQDRKSTRLNSSHVAISYAVFCLKTKTNCSTMAGRPSD